MPEPVIHKLKTHGDGKQHFAFFCPGCKHAHVFTDGWQFDGNMECPTISPSILVDGHYTDDDGTHHNIKCHSFVRSGVIEFLGDCTHPLANHKVKLEPF